MFNLDINFRYLWKAETWSYVAILKYFEIKFPYLDWGGGGGTQYTARNQVQIFRLIKCIEFLK